MSDEWLPTDYKVKQILELGTDKAKSSSLFSRGQLLAFPCLKILSPSFLWGVSVFHFQGPWGHAGFPTPKGDVSQADHLATLLPQTSRTNSQMGQWFRQGPSVSSWRSELWRPQEGERHSFLLDYLVEWAWDCWWTVLVICKVLAWEWS